MNDKQFRFQDLQVWQHAAGFSPSLFDLADQLDKRRLYRFAEITGRDLKHYEQYRGRFGQRFGH